MNSLELDGSFVWQPIMKYQLICPPSSSPGWSAKSLLVWLDPAVVITSKYAARSRLHSLHSGKLLCRALLRTLILVLSSRGGSSFSARVRL